MSLDLSMDKVLARRAEVEERLSQAAEMAPAEMTALSRELAELRPVCDQVALVRRLVSARAAAGWRLHCLRPICSACISVLPPALAGVLRLWKFLRQASADIKKPRPPSPGQMYLPG